jgi:glycosyltransferase involved in cell wall biosynthesis
VEYFCREIWPQVLTNAPEARFRIVGRKPHIRVKRLASPSIEVTGSVPSILPHLRDAAVLVVPLRMGGGTRVKIYEGMAMGKAMVSTFIGAEGLQVNDRRDILLADDPKQFAEFVVMLLGNEDVRRRYEAAAAAAVRNLDWSGIAQRFVKEAEKAVESVSRRKADELARTPNLRDLLGRSVSRRRNSYANSLKRDVNYENSR